MADDKEIGKNCAACKKALSRARRYYRNGDYYCNNNCFKNKQKQMVKEAAEAAGAAAE